MIQEFKTDNYYICKDNDKTLLTIEKLDTHLYRATNTEFSITAHVENIDDYTRLTICKDYKGNKKLFKHNRQWLGYILVETGFLPPIKPTILN